MSFPTQNPSHTLRRATLKGRPYPLLCRVLHCGNAMLCAIYSGLPCNGQQIHLFRSQIRTLRNYRSSISKEVPETQSTPALLLSPCTAKSAVKVRLASRRASCGQHPWPHCQGEVWLPGAEGCNQICIQIVVVLTAILGNHLLLASFVGASSRLQ